MKRERERELRYDVGEGEWRGAARDDGRPAQERQVQHKEHRLLSGESPLGTVDPSFQALSRRLKFTVRRHEFNTDSLSSSKMRACSSKPAAAPPSSTGWPRS